MIINVYMVVYVKEQCACAFAVCMYGLFFHESLGKKVNKSLNSGTQRGFSERI